MWKNSYEIYARLTLDDLQILMIKNETYVGPRCGTKSKWNKMNIVPMGKKVQIKYSSKEFLTCNGTA